MLPVRARTLLTQWCCRQFCMPCGATLCVQLFDLFLVMLAGCLYALKLFDIAAGIAHIDQVRMLPPVVRIGGRWRCVHVTDLAG